MLKKTIVTITGIRPDFIRMKNVFKQLDKYFHHIMIHTGQHYDDELSKIFFSELDIRTPDYILDSGKNSKNQYEQLSYLALEVPSLLIRENINPEIIIFLGDSHSAMVSATLFKEGYRIGHIEGGMRSYDRRMPEEVNRVICDYVSDYVFVYTSLYRDRLIAENKKFESIFIVGNTITEIVAEYMPSGTRSRDYILADIHRNENLHSLKQYLHILEFLNELGAMTGLPIKLVKFNRALQLISAVEISDRFPAIEVVGPYGFVEFLNLQYHAFGVVSDSGTSQEECPLLGVPVAVPRKHTERPESLDNGNSILIGESGAIKTMSEETLAFFKSYTISKNQIQWLGDGTTSTKIVQTLLEELEK
jgi:UDP-N-acetylglucosamine 2-epimerase